MKILSIILGKMIIVLGKIFQRGSSLPGKIALKIDKNLLKKFKLPSIIIAVTGSSGKGSTASIIAKIFEDGGKKVVYNKSGANLTNGITTMFLENCSLLGKIKGDVVVFEMDERYGKFVFPYITPTHVVITNITKDQPPRQGDVDIVYEDIKKSLPTGVKIVLNADDPYLQKFNINNEYDAVYYSIDKTELSYTDNKYRNLTINYCPKCNKKLKYEYYHFETLGKYNCDSCGFTNPQSKHTVSNIDYDNSTIIVDNKYHINLQYNMLYCVLNTMSALTLATLFDLNIEQIIASINSLDKNEKMYTHYIYNNSEVFLLNNKNENSTTFNQSISFCERFDGSKTIVIGWKEISRRYIFNDLSWLYDIDFEILNDKSIDNIICVGANSYDIATRIKLAGFESGKIKTFNTLDESKLFIDKNVNSKYIFAIVNFDYISPFKTIFIKKEV